MSADLSAPPVPERPAHVSAADCGSPSKDTMDVLVPRPAETGDRSLVAVSHVAKAKLTLVALDLATALGALVVAAAIIPAGEDRTTVAVLMLLAWAVFLARGRLYESRFLTRRADEVRRVSDATLAAAAATAVLCFVFRFEVGRMWLGVATLVGVVLLSAERELVRTYYDRQRRAGRFRRRVVMVGENDEARSLTEMFTSERDLGYDVVATVDARLAANSRALTTEVLAAVEGNAASGAVVAASAVETQSTNRLIRDLVEAGVHVELSSTLRDIEPSRLTVRPLGRYPVVYVEPVQRNGWRATAKKSFDLVLAAFGLLIAIPVLAAIAVAIKLDSPGPVLFRQRRVGQYGAHFDVLKFRTMVPDAEAIKADLVADSGDAGPLFKMKDDPRVTRVGRLLRKTSLDELPQLWNVIRGEMSLVGPRPALPSEMAEWHEDLFGRLRVKPGITGMWQVSGRSNTSFEEYTRLDLYYVDNWSLIVDLSVLLRTIPAVLRTDGAY